MHASTYVLIDWVKWEGGKGKYSARGRNVKNSLYDPYTGLFIWFFNEIARGPYVLYDKCIYDVVFLP